MSEFPKKYKSKINNYIVEFYDNKHGKLIEQADETMVEVGEHFESLVECVDDKYWEPYEESTKLSSSGGSTDYYKLPEGAKQLQDLIEHHNMNAQRKEVFKAAWRVGSKEGNDELYDWNKIVYFALREIGRLSNRKDYVAIAEEIIGDQ